MTRVQTTNYGALATTQFQWATTDDDLFDREFDLYRLAQAVEIHDHSSGHGLAVARIGAGVVDAAAMAALAVGTSTLQDLSVTNAKLAAGAVTRDKITYPLIQPTNDMAGGFRMRETANTYALGFYMAANGLAVFGAGSPATVGTNLILGQTGQVTVGSAQGGALFNVLQVSNAVAGGIRVYNSNTGFFGDFYNNASGWPAVAAGGNACVMFEPAARGALVIGSSASASGKLTIQQAAGTAAEGIYQSFGVGNFLCFVDTNNDVNLKSATTGVVLKHSAQAFHPVNNGQISLGISTLRWTTLYASSLDITSDATVGGRMTLNGSLTGVTSIDHTGHITPTGSNAYNLGDASHIYTQAYVRDMRITNTLQPTTNGSIPIGTVSLQFGLTYLSRLQLSRSSDGGSVLDLGADSAAKPSTNTWTISSDIRVKQQNSIRNYTRGLEAILKLRPVYYRYNGLGGTPVPDDQKEDSIGFLAHEVNNVAPEMVRVERRKLNPSDDKETELLNLNTHALMHMMVNAVKELTARLEALEDRKN
jgi:hypothetical protein